MTANEPSRIRFPPAAVPVARLSCCLLIASVVWATGCNASPETALTQLVESRRFAADLLVQLTKSADSSNRAVMADTDEASTTFAREAEQATAAVQKDVEALRPLLSNLGFTNEAQLLKEFNRRHGEYRKVDREILSLAVENTNLKAQRLSFGPASEATDLFRRSVAGVVAANRANDDWHVKALIGTAVSAVRQIQVLQAPHIAEANDEAMTRMEKQMATSEAEARAALHSLQGLASPASRGQVAAAASALDRFMELNAQIVALSRRNTNVRSLALALGQKRTLTASCEDQLRQLQDALANRDFKATR